MKTYNRRKFMQSIAKTCGLVAAAPMALFAGIKYATGGIVPKDKIVYPQTWKCATFYFTDKEMRMMNRHVFEGYEHNIMNPDEIAFIDIELFNDTINKMHFSLPYDHNI